jgi:hypothetical protein
MLLCISGGIAVFIGYWGVSATLDPGKQLPYIISGGIGGVFLLGLGASLLFANDIAASRRDITELRHLVEAISETLDEIRAAQDAEASDADASPNGVPRRNRPLDARK